MADYSSIVNSLQIEITSYCNAFCPGCGRNYKGGETIPELNLKHIDLDLWKKILNDDFFTQKVKIISLNGMFGDPLMHPKIYQMVELLPKNLYIEIHTNGSIRNPEFWSKFGVLLSQFDEHSLIWGIDGLEDTNHLYRRGTKWSNIIKNLEAFNSAGGMSEWWMTVFQHNKHQILETKKLALELNCKTFSTRESYSDRLYAKNYRDMPSHDCVAVSQEEIESILGDNTFIDVNEFDNDNVINICPWLSTRFVQIDSNGKIWPCCYTREQPVTKANYDDIWTFPNIENDLNVMTFEEIFQGEFFKNTIDDVWSQKKSQMCNSCISGVKP
jgi:MoaA/NifB/PqqE/SkfB family radical SAM enzyme